jgi:hypothetical protein
MPTEIATVASTQDTSLVKTLTSAAIIIATPIRDDFHPVVTLLNIWLRYFNFFWFNSKQSVLG